MRIGHRHASGSPPARRWSRGRSARRSTSWATRRSSSRRPGKGPRRRPERAADPVWDQPGSPQGSDADVPGARVRGLGRRTTRSTRSLCDQNYQFDEIAALRADGVRTIGPLRLGALRRASTRSRPGRPTTSIYSLTRAEQERYRSLRDREPLRHLGHPPGAARDRAEEFESASGERRAAGEVWFYVPGSFMGKRKPFAEIVEAFTRARATTCGCWSAARWSARRAS